MSLTNLGYLVSVDARLFGSIHRLRSGGGQGGSRLHPRPLLRLLTVGLFALAALAVSGSAEAAAPTAADGTVTTPEDTAYTFRAADFNFMDADPGDTLASVKIVTLPAAGRGILQLNNANMSANDTVTATQLENGDLTYTPPADANGTDYASFTFTVNDGAADSAAPSTMTLNVTAVNDPATGMPTITAPNVVRVPAVLRAALSGLTDPDGLPSSFSYQWQRFAADGTTFEANLGTAATYTLTAAEAGKRLKVAVTFTDADGHAEGPLTSAASPPTGTVQAAAPVLLTDHLEVTQRGDPDGVKVSVLDGNFGSEGHGRRISNTFLARTPRTRLFQISGWGHYRIDGRTVTARNAPGYIKHALEHNGGIVWTATDESFHYRPPDSRWFIENGRPFYKEARAFATWMQHENTLFIASIENAGTPLCDDYDASAEWWTPPCGAIDDYIAHSGVGQANTIFAGAIDTRWSRDLGMAAIRADGVFAPHAIYVESPDGSTSHATAVLAAYAAELAAAYPTWGAAQLKQGLLDLARDETVQYVIGSNSQGTVITEPRTLKVIRPADLNRFNRGPAFATATRTLRVLLTHPTVGQLLSRITATDPDGDAVTYGLRGDDAGLFTIDSATGRLRVAWGLDYWQPEDHNQDNRYEVIVTARDGKDGAGAADTRVDDTVAATIVVLNEAPAFLSTESGTRSVPADTPAGGAVGLPVTASPAFHQYLTYTVQGPDAAVFAVDRWSGQLRTTAAVDSGTQPEYRVTVTAADPFGFTASLPLTISVTAVNSAPTFAAPSVTRSLAAPTPVGQAVGRPIVATDSDHDALTYSLAGQDASFFAIDARTGQLRTAVAVDAESRQRYVVTVLVHDGRNAGGNPDLTPDARITVTIRVILPSPPPVSPGGGGGGSGNGGGSGGGGSGGGTPACAQDDVHGNTPAQATAMALATETTGAICPAADVDYFTVTAPGRGLLFVDTAGGISIRGTLWQDGVVVASGPTAGRGQADRLGALVQAGPVVVAVQGQGGATGLYTVGITFVRGYLENPGDLSFQSGVGVLSGWVCEANRVEIELNGVPQAAAYGTERLDTQSVCEDTDNGFGLLFNWNLLGDGEHEVVAFVDGVELGRATVTVTTLGAEFVREVEGECVVEDFPLPGEQVTLVWQQNSQNFVMAGGSPPTGAATDRASGLTGLLENPGQNSFQSGVRVLSGWVCDADAVEVELGHLGRQMAAYGTERLDTEPVCGDTDNGFGLLFNWNLLGDGKHEIVAYVDDVELGRATVRVTTLGEEFLQGVEGECVVEDFPAVGQSVLLEWQQPSQNFVIVDVP